jgi:Ca2+-binding EF-hand superfamily protein
MANDPKALFAIFDKDGDGGITVKEIGAVMRQLGQDPTDEELAAIVQEVDADGNGEIELEEFVAVLNREDFATLKLSAVIEGAKTLL